MHSIESRIRGQVQVNLALVVKIKGGEDPCTFKQTHGKPKWDVIMKSECDTLMRNHIWHFLPRPIGKSIVGCKWVHKNKYTSVGEMEKHKA